MGAHHLENLPMTATTGTAEKGHLCTTDSTVYYTAACANVHKEHSLVCCFAPETHLQQG